MVCFAQFPKLSHRKSKHMLLKSRLKGRDGTGACAWGPAAGVSAAAAAVLSPSFCYSENPVSWPGWSAEYCSCCQARCWARRVAGGWRAALATTSGREGGALGHGARAAWCPGRGQLYCSCHCKCYARRQVDQPARIKMMWRIMAQAALHRLCSHAQSFPHTRQCRPTAPTLLMRCRRSCGWA